MAVVRVAQSIAVNKTLSVSQAVIERSTRTTSIQIRVDDPMLPLVSVLGDSWVMNGCLQIMKPSSLNPAKHRRNETRSLMYLMHLITSLVLRALHRRRMTLDRCPQIDSSCCVKRVASERVECSTLQWNADEIVGSFKENAETHRSSWS